MSRLISLAPQLGADPEVFIAEQGKKSGTFWIRGSERIIPPEGLSNSSYPNYGKVVRDGVQAELHPHPSTCRESLSVYIATNLQTLDQAAKKAGLSIDFRQVVKVTKLELDKLAPENQVLGCAPSLNFYGIPPLEVDGREMRVRSGSGHFHIGHPNIGIGKPVTPDALVPALDLFVGIPAVLIDRDPGAAERRKYYGRAGEYRLPKHGLEYRTLSNFWLRDYKVYHLMAGQVRNAVALAYSATLPKNTFGYNNIYNGGLKELMSRFDPKATMEAINQNDEKAAWDIWNHTVRPVINNITDHNTGIYAANVKEFEFFAKKGLDFWFGKPSTSSIMNSWGVRGAGWESFAQKQVRPKMQQAAMEGA